MEYDQTELEQYANFIVQNFSGLPDEQLDSFSEISELELDLTLLNAGVPISGEDFLTMIDAWQAGEEECGAFIGIGEYTFEVQGTNNNNISKHQNVLVSLRTQEIGNIKDEILRVENGKLVVKSEKNSYDGYMLSMQYTDVTLNGSIISGELVVQEWLNGTVQIEPKTLPKLVIKNQTIPSFWRYFSAKKNKYMEQAEERGQSLT